MSHVPHELAEDFPNLAPAIRDLRMKNAHFARLVDEYHEINRSVHRSEINVDALGDGDIRALRVRRMQLKDEIASMLTTCLTRVD